ncbi:MAG: DUF748 domain-containing protein [Piscinibacter sp.]|nr:DUF748 domain-containing protein [Piscinibacter sp.]
MSSVGRRRWWIALGVLAALAVAALAGLRLAAQRLEVVLQQALGPRASIGNVALGWYGLELRDLRVRAAAGWPAEDELRAARVRVSPSMASLWSGRWQIRRIEIEQGYLSLLRTRQGKLRLLPALLERPSTGSAGTPVQVDLAHVELAGTTIDFFDASVRQVPHRVRLEALDAGVGPIAWPALDRATDVELQARLKGPQRDGTLALSGWLTAASRDASLKASVHGVDLVALQPYLLKVNEGGVRRGTLDLQLDATVKAQHLHAPGRLTLTGLELASGGGLLSTFAGVPRQAVLAAMQRDGRIDFRFTLDGRLDDPAFSINDNLATRVAGGLAETLGVSLGGVVEGVGGVIRGLLGR